MYSRFFINSRSTCADYTGISISSPAARSCLSESETVSLVLSLIGRRAHNDIETTGLNNVQVYIEKYHRYDNGSKITTLERKCDIYISVDILKVGDNVEKTKPTNYKTNFIANLIVNVFKRNIQH